MHICLNQDGHPTDQLSMKHVEADSAGCKQVLVRRTLLINPKFQLSFLTYIVGIAAKVLFFYQTRAFMGLKISHRADGGPIKSTPDHEQDNYAEERCSKKAAYSDLFERLLEPTFLISPKDFMILDSNAAAERVLERDRAALLQHAITELSNAELRDSVEKTSGSRAESTTLINSRSNGRRVRGASSS